MPSALSQAPCAFAKAAIIISTAWFLGPPALEAQVRRIVIDNRESPAFNGETFGSAGQYETLAGRAFGELDPADPRNALVTDIQLASRNARGRVEYVATFYLVKPLDMSRSSGLMWHDVPNRGGRVTIAAAERHDGDIGLSSGWQGDNSGRTAPGDGNEYLIAPIARNHDGSPIAGRVLGRIVNASGMQSRPLIVHTNPVPYRPATLDTADAILVTHASERIDGAIDGAVTVPAEDWAWARCDDDNPFPGIPDPTEICLRNGFNPELLYQVVYTAQDPYVLGIGFAAFRDVAAFFRYAARDDEGTPNPVAGEIKWVISRGRSQSGSFLRGLIHLGFTQDEDGRRVHDGAWPIIAGRRITLNSRFALPDGTLKLYDAGGEGPQWWAPWPDPVRGIPEAGMLDRCTATGTCPRIMEHFGPTEIWALGLSPSLVGTTAEADIPLPENVRRYYLPSTPHGGGGGGFSVTPPPPPACPGFEFGMGMLPANPLPHTETVNALRVHFRNWVMHDSPPPPSRWPTLAGGELVDPVKAAMGFPTMRGVPGELPTGLANPVLDYDWGPEFNHRDGSGVPTKVPPEIRNVIKLKVPRTDADGNEMGGVPIVLRDAPLGTYLGWNIVAAGFHQGKICNHAGGMIPFAETKAERLGNGDPRLSLEERYGSHAGYVEAVKAAAARAVSEGFLLEEDAAALVRQAVESAVLRRGQTD